MGLLNEGTINADQSTPLYVHTSSGTTNKGTLEATAGANLILVSDTFTNTGGTIQASGAGSVVTVQGATIVGGTLNTTGGGLIQASNNPTLSGVTNQGTYQISNGNTTALEGTVTNNGTVQVNSTGANTYLYINGNATLSGNGTIALSSAPQNIFEGIAGTEVLTNNGNTIEGSGALGNGRMGIVNNGTILANQATKLTVTPNSSGFTNNLAPCRRNTGSLLDITERSVHQLQ